MDVQRLYYYVSRLSCSKTASNVELREIGDMSLYTLGLTRRMTADLGTGLIEFENYTATFSDSGLTNSRYATSKGLSDLQMTNLASSWYF